MTSHSTGVASTMRDALSAAGFALADAGAVVCATVHVSRSRTDALVVSNDESVDDRLVDIAKSVANGVCREGEVTVSFGARGDGAHGIIDVDVRVDAR